MNSGIEVSTKIPITMSALLQRINRLLRKRGQRLSSRATHVELGLYYILDATGVIHPDVDPIRLGWELGVLRPFECVEGVK